MLAYGDGGGGDDEDDDDEFTLNARIENKKSGNVMSLPCLTLPPPKWSIYYCRVLFRFLCQIICQGRREVTHLIVLIFPYAGAEEIATAKQTKTPLKILNLCYLRHFTIIPICYLQNVVELSRR